MVLINATMKNISKLKRQQIHDYLKLGFGLTKLDCLMMFGYINLGDYIHVLRKKYGYDYIVNKMLKNHKTGAKYVSYMINEKYLE